MKRKLGTRDGKPVIATFTRSGQSGLPVLKIHCAGQLLGSYRGSSLGPVNAACAPDEADINYWRTLVADDLDDA